ncbi:hypothetical protein KT99_16936, partial [Shewanella benthica KT99]
GYDHCASLGDLIGLGLVFTLLVSGQELVSSNKCNRLRLKSERAEESLSAPHS